MGRITQLQKIGLSYLLTDLMHHGNHSLIRGGTISFVTNSNARWIIMDVHGYDGNIYRYTLEYEENIDGNTRYAFSYDGTDRIFKIVEIIEERNKDV